MKKRTWLGSLLLMLALVLITGCFGGSGSGGSNTDDSSGDTSGDTNGDTDSDLQVTAFEGEVLAPGGELAFLEKPALNRLAGWVLGESHAAISGLSPVAGITIELIEVDDDGNQLGDVLATGITSNTGDYTLTLPENALRAPAANLVIRAVGLTQELRAQAVAEDVRVDPVSEFVLRKLIDFKVPLSTVETAAVVRIRGDIDKLDIDAGAEGLDSAFAALEESAGAYMDSEAETVATADAADFTGVLGNWVLAGLRPEMGYRTGGTGTLGAFSENSGFALEDLDGALAVRSGVVAGEGFFMEQSSFTDNTGSLYGPEVETDPLDPQAGAETGVILLSEDLSFRLEGEVSESVVPEDDFAQRRTEGTVRFRFAGDHLRVGLNRAFEQLYGVTGDGLLDEADFRGERLLTELSVIGRAPETLAAADLTGNYGLISFGMQLEDTYAGMFSFVDQLDFDGNGTANFSSGADQLEVEHFFGSPAQLQMPTDPDEPLTYSVDGTGVVVDGDLGLAVTADLGAMFGSFSGFDEAAARSEQMLILGVRLPDSQPDMEGRRYRIQGLSMRMSGNGALDKEIRQFAELAFSGGNVTLDGERERLVQRATPSSEPVVSSDDSGASVGPLSYVLGTNGRLEITTGNTTLEGYVAADGDVVVLRDFVDEGNGDYTLGIWIGVRVE